MNQKRKIIVYNVQQMLKTLAELNQILDSKQFAKFPIAENYILMHKNRIIKLLEI